MKKPTLEDLVTLAHRSGMRVSIDLVPKRADQLILIALPNGKWLRKVSWDECWHLLKDRPPVSPDFKVPYRRLYANELGGYIARLPKHVRKSITEIEAERRAQKRAWLAQIKKETRDKAAALKAFRKAAR